MPYLSWGLQYASCGATSCREMRVETPRASVQAARCRGFPRMRGSGSAPVPEAEAASTAGKIILAFFFYPFPTVLETITCLLHLRTPGAFHWSQLRLRLCRIGPSNPLTSCAGLVYVKPLPPFLVCFGGLPARFQTAAQHWGNLAQTSHASGISGLGTAVVWWQAAQDNFYKNATTGRRRWFCACGGGG